MKTLLANKQTEEQKKANDNVRYLFIMAMMNLDEKAIFSLLNKNSLFLGNKNNWQFTNWLSKQFDSFKSFGFHSRFSEGISLEQYPGSETLNFFFSPMEKSENFFDEEYNPFADLNNEKIIKLSFVLNFDNGKIKDIRLVFRSVNNEQIKKYQLEN